MKRIVLGCVAIVALALVAGGVALAIEVQCQPTPSECIGTNNDDLLIGSSGSDNMAGLKGDDVLKGRGGDDNFIRGDQGADKILGGAGSDFMEGGTGKDVVKGGDGDDSYSYGQGWGRETIVDTPIVDTDLNTGHFVRFDFVTEDLTIDLNSGQGPEVKNQTKTSTLNWDNDLIDGVVDGAGHDTITGREVGDNIQIFGSRGDSDTVIAGGGDDFVNTKDGDGFDNILCGEGTNDFVIKDAGDTAFDCEGIG